MEQEQNIFTIVTPSYNQGQFLTAAITSILSQEGDFYIDYIIMDGGSTDDSVSVIQRFETLLEQNCDKQEIAGLTYYTPRAGDNSVCLCKGISYRWQSGPDKGQADAVNSGLKLAEGNIFAYLNADDIYEPFAFQQALTTFTQNSGHDVVYGNAVFINAAGEVTGAYPSKDVNEYDLTQQCYLSQPSVFIKTSAMRLAGPFNADIRNSLDYEYWLRLMSMGMKFVFIQPVLSATRLHGDSKTSRNQMRIKIECLAIVQHYSGTTPSSWVRALAQDASFMGIASSYFLNGWQKLREGFIGVFAPFYFVFKRGAIAKERKRLFKN